MTACWPSARRWLPSTAAAGWGSRVFVWHEAADTRLFRPPQAESTRGTASCGSAIGAMASVRPKSRIICCGQHRRQGWRLTFTACATLDAALAQIARHGARYRGWTPKHEGAGVFARHLATVHVPRRFYVETLPGIPTIRVFEALACGIPLVSAPWHDSERLFSRGNGLSGGARRGRDDEASPRAGRPTPRCGSRWRSTGLPPSTPATAACTARRSFSPSPSGWAPTRWRLHDPHRLLRIEPGFLLLERRRHLLPRPAAQPARGLATDITFYEPDAYRAAGAPRHRCAGLGRGPSSIPRRTMACAA